MVSRPSGLTRRRLIGAFAATPILGIPVLAGCCPKSMRGKTRAMPFIRETENRECDIEFCEVEDWLRSLFTNVDKKHKFHRLKVDFEKQLLRIELRKPGFEYGTDPNK